MWFIVLMVFCCLECFDVGWNFFFFFRMFHELVVKFDDLDGDSDVFESGSECGQVKVHPVLVFLRMVGSSEWESKLGECLRWLTFFWTFGCVCFC